jgi:glutathione synthase/RimK-type ligase-like ATP-grasp enzyme
MANNKPKLIGSKTIVNFPKFGINKVPAKVDTGADSSSIWASNIKERAGKLSFTLFSPDSPYYTGEIITTKDYQLRSIKNSFGVAEFRYKVRLHVEVEAKEINVRFTLSNRAENRFPVLIGRRTLHGRFVVDVSHSKEETFNVLVIRSSKKSATTESIKFFAGLKKTNKNMKFIFVGLDELDFNVSRDQGNRVIIHNTGKDISEFDLVYFRVINFNLDIAAVAADYLKKKRVPFTDRLVLSYVTPVNKLYQYFCLNSFDIDVPNSTFIIPERLSKSFSQLKKDLGLPFVLKDIYGKKGRNITLVSNKEEFESACKKAKSKDVKLLAQEFIEHDGHYRLLIFGKRIEMIMFLIHKLANPRLKGMISKEKSQTKLIDEHAIPGEIRMSSIEAANYLNIDIAGVDMIQDKESGIWYCLEVNENPQLVTGSFIKEKEESFTEYITRTLG